MGKKQEDYEIKIYTIETTSGIEYVAEIPELKGCVGSGESYEEALQELLDNKEVYLETLKELGREIPVPKSKKQQFSGKLSLRLSSRLHQKVSEVADECKVSINQFIVETLAEAVGSHLKVFNLSKEIVKKQETRILKDIHYESTYDEFLFPQSYGGIN